MTGDITPPEQPWWQPSLRCPDCGATPREEGGGHACSRCGWFRQDWHDWRGLQPRPLLIEHQRHNAADPEQQLQQLQTQAPRLSYQGPKALRDSTAFLSVLQQELPPGARVLDLGCGPLGEPFHASYSHHSAWGLLAWLDELPQLRAERLWPTCDTLTSLSGMGRYPRVIRAGLALLDRLHHSLPILAPQEPRDRCAA